MTEEEYFRKNYPDSCYGDRPLSPHWDFFQDGVEFGERQSEKKIAELEDQLTKAKDLLKQWLQTSKASGCDNINIVTDTEQFLSEVEK